MLYIQNIGVVLLLLLLLLIDVAVIDSCLFNSCWYYDFMLTYNFWFHVATRPGDNYFPR